jgi:hypothetical protein
MNLGSSNSPTAETAPGYLIAQLRQDPRGSQLQAASGGSLTEALSKSGAAALTPTAIGAIIAESGAKVIHELQALLRHTKNRAVLDAVDQRIKELAAGQQTPGVTKEAAVLAHVYLRWIETGQPESMPQLALYNLAAGRRTEPNRALDALDIVGFALNARKDEATANLVSGHMTQVAESEGELTLTKPLVAMLARNISGADILNPQFDKLLLSLADTLRRELRLNVPPELMSAIDDGIVGRIGALLTNGRPPLSGDRLSKVQDILIAFATAGSPSAATICTGHNLNPKLLAAVTKLVDTCTRMTTAQQEAPRGRLRSGEFQALGRVLENISTLGDPASKTAAEKMIGKLCCAELRNHFFHVTGDSGKYKPIAEAVRYLEKIGSYLEPIQKWVLDETTTAGRLKFDELQRRKGVVKQFGRENEFITTASPHVRSAIVTAAGAALGMGHRGAWAAEKLLVEMGLVIKTVDPTLAAKVADPNKREKIKVVTEALFAGRITPVDLKDREVRLKAWTAEKNLERGIRWFLDKDPSKVEILAAATVAAEQRLASDTKIKGATVLKLNFNPGLLKRLFSWPFR